MPGVLGGHRQLCYRQQARDRTGKADTADCTAAESSNCFSQDHGDARQAGNSLADDGFATSWLHSRQTNDANQEQNKSETELGIEKPVPV